MGTYQVDTDGGSYQVETEDSSPQWSDLPKNIIPDAESVGKSILTPWPLKAIDAIKSAATAKSPLEAVERAAAPTLPGAISQIPKSVENLGSKEEWIQHPVQNAATVASMAYPAGKALLAPAESGIAASMGEAMRSKGANMGAEMGEVGADTIKKMNPNVLGDEGKANIRTADNKPNIADVRTETGAKLINEGVVGGFGQDVGDRIQAANEKLNSYGKQVDSAIGAIKDYNKSTGEYENVDDAIHVQATPILKNILDTANELRDSARSGIRQTSRFWRETYNSLAKKAEGNNGRLNLDDVRSEMQEVGKDMNAGPNTPRFATAKDIYGHLAEVRDQMVNQIAEQSGNPKLASNLLDANKGYSFYSRITKGLEEAGAGGEVPEKMGRHLVRSTMRGDPLHATGYLGLMKALNAVEPAFAQKLMQYGPFVQKYGGALETAAKQGPRQLAMTNYLIGQKDPEYRQAMQQ